MHRRKFKVAAISAVAALGLRARRLLQGQRLGDHHLGCLDGRRQQFGGRPRAGLVGDRRLRIQAAEIAEAPARSSAGADGLPPSSMSDRPQAAGRHRLQGLPAPVLAGGQEGAEREADKLGVQITFEGPPTEPDVEQQIDDADPGHRQEAGRARLRRARLQGRAPLMEQAKAENIPVIAFDSGVDSDIPLTTASTDNKAAAAEAAKHMAELIGDKGKVAMVVHDQTSGPASSAATASWSG